MLVCIGLLMPFQMGIAEDCPEDIKRPKKFQKVELPNGAHYLIHVPKEYEANGEWGIMLILHGQCQNTDGMMNAFLYGCEGGTSFFKNHKYIGIVPQARKEVWGQRENTPMLALLDTLTTYRVNRGRVHLFGTSAGGWFTGWLGYERPDVFKTMTIVAAGLGLADKRAVRKFEDRPVYFLVGETDDNLKHARRDFEKLVSHGNDYARLNVVEGEGHQIRYWKRFDVLSTYYKAIESGFDYAGKLKKAESLVTKDLKQAIAISREFKQQPKEEVFWSKYQELRKRIDEEGLKRLKMMLYRLKGKRKKLVTALASFEKMFEGFPVAQKATEVKEKLSEPEKKTPPEEDDKGE
ncbi:MAG: hypothetical protein U5N86_05225 [Planctomycetota bacterium]|nr:hypothetical protein [Planctomycetota bacterium]